MKPSAKSSLSALYKLIAMMKIKNVLWIYDTPDTRTSSMNDKVGSILDRFEGEKFGNWKGSCLAHQNTRNPTMLRKGPGIDQRLDAPHARTAWPDMLCNRPPVPGTGKASQAASLEL